MDFAQILREAGANVIPLEIEVHRPEIVAVLLAQPEAITGMSIPEMVASAWPGKAPLNVVARLSRPPWDRMAEDIREWLLVEGWYWRDTREGRRWFPPEYDSGAWAETE